MPLKVRMMYTAENNENTEQNAHHVHGVASQNAIFDSESVVDAEKSFDMDNDEIAEFR